MMEHDQHVVDEATAALKSLREVLVRLSEDLAWMRCPLIAELKACPLESWGDEDRILLLLAGRPDETKWKSWQVVEATDGQWFYWLADDDLGRLHVDQVGVEDGVIFGKHGCGLDYYTMCQPCVFSDDVLQILKDRDARRDVG